MAVLYLEHQREGNPVCGEQVSWPPMTYKLNWFRLRLVLTRYYKNRSRISTRLGVVVDQKQIYQQQNLLGANGRVRGRFTGTETI